MNESKSSPLILFVKDIEKSLAGNNDAYGALKSKVENLPSNVVVIGSHTQLDSRKEKVILYCPVKSFSITAFLN